MKRVSISIYPSVSPTVFVITALIFLGMASAVSAQQSLSLGDAIDTALDKNYSIRVRNQSILKAETNNSWGAAGRLPSVGFSATMNGRAENNDSQSTTTGSLSPGVNLNWTLFDGFGIRIRKERFDTLERLSRGNASIVIEQTVQGVILAYYKALYEQEKLDVFEEVMTLSHDRFKHMQEKKNLGAAVTYDVLQAQNAWLEDKAAWLLQKTTLENTVRDLNFLMGVPEERLYMLTDDFSVDMHEYDSKTLESKMLVDNRTLKNQYINQVLKEKEIALAKSLYYPTLSLRTGIEHTGSRIKNENMDAVSRDVQGGYATLTLNYSLFDGGSRKRAMRIAKIEEETGQIETAEMKHSLSNQLAKLLSLYSVRKELLNVADENLAAAKLNMDISEDRYRNGTINSFNYRDVQLIYLRASNTRLNAIYNLIDTDTALLRLTGGIITEGE